MSSSLSNLGHRTHSLTLEWQVDCSRWLPYSLWTVILSMLPRKDLLSVLAVNRTLNMVGSHVLVLQELEVKYVHSQRRHSLPIACSLELTPASV